MSQQNNSTMTRQPGKAVAANKQNGNGRGRRRKAKAAAYRPKQSVQLHSTQPGANRPLVPYSIKAGSTPGGMRMAGRELIRTVNPSASFILDTFELNPISFPRLGSIAPTFEQYFFHDARFIYQPIVPLTTTGAIMIAVDYDAKDIAPTTSTIMMRNVSSVLTAVYSDAVCELNSGYSRLRRYNVTETVTPADPAQVHQAVVYVAGEGLDSAVTTYGYFIVEYDVEFFTPQ